MEEKEGKGVGMVKWRDGKGKERRDGGIVKRKGVMVVQWKEGKDVIVTVEDTE